MRGTGTRMENGRDTSRQTATWGDVVESEHVNYPEDPSWREEITRAADHWVLSLLYCLATPLPVTDMLNPDHTHRGVLDQSLK